MHFIGKFFQITFGALFTLLTLGAIAAFSVYSYYARQLPDDQDLRKIDIQVPLRIYSRENQLIAEYGERRSNPVKLNEVPEKLQEAFIAIEDNRFYEHNGVDFKGIVRALYSVISTGSASQGASTITMQLARNAFLNSDKTVDRKLKETLLAIKLEQKLTKKEILELYLNKIYLGKSAYGVAAAAETYYGKPLDQLTLAQEAMIAGLPKAPSRYNPVVNPQRAMIRRNYILQRMLELGNITKAEYDTAVKEPNTATVHETSIETNAPYLAEMVRAEIVKRYGVTDAYNQGYNVYTTLDSKEQIDAEEALRRSLMSYDRRHGYRGAEDKLNMDEFKNEEEMRDKLSTYPTLGGLEPALVVSSGAKSAELLVGENKIALDMDAVSWARPFRNADRRGPAPRRVSDVLKAGDIVRVRQNEKDQKWMLSQVPTVGGALVSLDPKDGAIRAIVGGFDFYYSKFNRATQASRQPGSSFKPFIYSAALAKGFSPSSIVNDAPISIPGSNWRPQNFGGHYIGPTTMAEALAKSRNLVSIRILRAIGVNYAIDFATRFGFPRADLPPNLTLALGTAMTTPLDMATAYSAFANGGYKIEPYFITQIRDASDKLLDEVKPLKVCGDDVETCKLPAPNTTRTTKNKAESEQATASEQEQAKKQSDKKPSWETDELSAKQSPTDNMIEYPAAKRILDSRTHYQIVTMLQGVTRFGTAARATRILKRTDIAGKTGTTNDQKDSWFCGFTPKVVTVAWVGFDDMAKLGEGETATNVALPLWIDFMHRILAGTPSKEWERPANFKEAAVVNIDQDIVGSTEVSTPSQGFQYKNERDLNIQQGGQRTAPVRRPERVEIPEQLF